MPTILVLKRPEDTVSDKINCADNKVGEKTQELYNKLNSNYSIEVRYD